MQGPEDRAGEGHPSIAAQMKRASHKVKENQDNLASKWNRANQHETASHVAVENQNVQASHVELENQVAEASRSTTSNPIEASEPRRERKPSAISEPSTVSKPSNLSEPTMARKPSIASGPLLSRKPSDNSEPRRLSNPLAHSEPQTLSKPSQSSEPYVARKPTFVSEPLRDSNPKNESEPIIDRKPTTRSEPTAVRKPLQISEPPRPNKPSLCSEPVKARKPSHNSEPSDISNPKKDSEPYTRSKPQTNSEPFRPSNPLNDSEPISSRKPQETSEPQTPSKPSEDSEPAIVSKPFKISEPKNDSNPTAGSASFSLAVSLGYTATGGYFDHQKLRTAHMNRVRDLLRKLKEGIPLDAVEKKLEGPKKFDKKYKDANLPRIIEELAHEGKISKEQEKHLETLLKIAKEENGLEDQYKILMERSFNQFPIFIRLHNVKGIGPVLASALVSWFDIRKADHISSFWRYAGLDVLDGKAIKRKKAEKLPYNLKVHTLMWKIADSMVKQRTPEYRKIYDEAKIVELVKLKETGKGWKLHAELRAKRKMVKMFLADFWWTWRELEHLPLSEPYAIGILGHDKQPRKMGLPNQRALSK